MPRGFAAAFFTVLFADVLADGFAVVLAGVLAALFAVDFVAARGTRCTSFSWRIATLDLRRRALKSCTWPSRNIGEQGVEDVGCLTIADVAHGRRTARRRCAGASDCGESVLGTVHRWRRWSSCTARSGSPTTSSPRSAASSVATRTTSSSRSSRSCGPSTAPTSRRGSTSSRLPTEGERVLVGPGENAGVIDAGDGIAVAIRIESHNHPSAIEPHQGAATGVGGILRDIFTMGARPCASWTPSSSASSTTRGSAGCSRASSAGISSYGNSVGVPTVGGELTFDAGYEGNPLVNVLCMGALPVERLVLGRASGVGNLAVLLGSSTGRDGIGGVSVLASAGFEAGAVDDDKRPSVQVGDPYEEKRLIEACLELLDRGLVVGIQDLGGAGLACATSETAARGGLGMDVDVTAVPRREPGMVPAEVMTSESQERMLAIVDARARSTRSSRSARAGRSTATVVGQRDRADRPGRRAGRAGCGSATGSTARSSPRCRRRRSPTTPRATTARWRGPPTSTSGSPTTRRTTSTAARARDDLLGPRRRPRVGLPPVRPPAVLEHRRRTRWRRGAAAPRRSGPARRRRAGVAITTDSNPRACALDPRGGHRARARRVDRQPRVRRGASRRAVVNCLNFGNPEHPEVMWQLSECVDGLAEACRGLRRAGRRRQRLALQRERGARHRPDAGARRRSAWSTSSSARPPGLAHADGATRSCVLGAAPRRRERAPHPLGGIRMGRTPGAAGGARRVLDVVGAPARRATSSSTWSRPSLRGRRRRRHRRARRLVGRARRRARRAVPRERRRARRSSGVDGHRELFCELPSRFLVATPRPRRRRLRRPRRRACRSACSARRPATASSSRGSSTWRSTSCVPRRVASPPTTSSGAGRVAGQTARVARPCRRQRRRAAASSSSRSPSGTDRLPVPVPSAMSGLFAPW